MCGRDVLDPRLCLWRGRVCGQARFGSVVAELRGNACVGNFELTGALLLDWETAEYSKPHDFAYFVADGVKNVGESR